jgi:hypothetical protein
MKQGSAGKMSKTEKINQSTGPTWDSTPLSIYQKEDSNHWKREKTARFTTH